MIQLSHIVATRGFAPIIAKRRELPAHISLVRLGQMVVNPHFSFPINEAMLASGIPEDFRRNYNDRMKYDCIKAVRTPSEHPNKYHQLWAMAPSGTRDTEGQGEHADKWFIREVQPGTLRLIRLMKVGLLPVYTSFGDKQRPTAVKLGSIIPPNEVSPLAIHTIMANMAEFRRGHGEDNIYYEGEL